MSGDPLDKAIGAASAAHEAAKRAAAEKQAQERRAEAERSASDQRRRVALQEIGRSFVSRARAAGVAPEGGVEVCVGTRDRYGGFFNRRKVGVESVYESRQAWTIQPYYHEKYSGSSSLGIYVLEDGSVVGSLATPSWLPAEDVDEVTRRLGEYLVSRGVRR
jgi:hypothetical protein